MILWHYTCQHAAAKIEKSGRLLPFPHPLLPQVPPMVWLTDLDMAHPPALGLTRIQAGCDRASWRVTADVDEPLHWPRWARRNLPHKQYNPVEVNCPGSLIAHWWLAFTAVPVAAVEPVGGIR